MIYQNLHNINSLFYGGHKITQVICNNHILFSSKEIDIEIPPQTFSSYGPLVLDYQFDSNTTQNDTPTIV